MKDLINIFSILENAPSGLKLYSPLFGTVEFEYIDETCEDSNYPIIVIVNADNNSGHQSFDAFGRYYNHFTEAECLLFPSNLTKNWHFWGDYLLKKGDFITDGCRTLLVYDFPSCYTNTNKNISVDRDTLYKYASLKEINEFKEKLQQNGFYYNEESKTIKKIEISKNENKDSNDEIQVLTKKESVKGHTFKPFDKVLVRDTENETWHCELFSHVTYYDVPCFHCVGGEFNMCIPYNNYTKQLLGTKENYKNENCKS